MGTRSRTSSDKAFNTYIVAWVTKDKRREWLRSAPTLSHRGWCQSKSRGEAGKPCGTLTPKGAAHGAVHVALGRGVCVCVCVWRFPLSWCWRVDHCSQATVFSHTHMLNLVRERSVPARTCHGRVREGRRQTQEGQNLIPTISFANGKISCFGCLSNSAFSMYTLSSLSICRRTSGLLCGI